MRLATRVTHPDHWGQRPRESTPTKRHAKNGVKLMQIVISIFIVMTRLLHLEVQDIFAQSSPVVTPQMFSKMAMVGISIENRPLLESRPRLRPRLRIVDTQATAAWLHPPGGPGECRNANGRIMILAKDQSEEKPTRMAWVTPGIMQTRIAEFTTKPHSLEVGLVWHSVEM